MKVSRHLRRMCVKAGLLDMTAAPPNLGVEDIRVIPNAVSEDEHDTLASEVNDWLVRKPFEVDHFDSVIVGYRELERELERWSSKSASVLSRLQRDIDDRVRTWLPPHIIDLRADGRIDPHVDSVKFSGGIVAGLSLLSTRVMVLRPASMSSDVPPTAMVRMLLPPRSMYILCGAARFEMNHEVSANPESWALEGNSDNAVRPDRRISVIFRDAPSRDDADLRTSMSGSL